MTKIATIFAASAFLGLAASTAFAAGVTKTWVSSTTGNDSGTCQFTTPCKTFAYAVTQTLPGGELDVKDGGSYGPVTITQAVSIVNEGFLAQISVPANGTGITVNAGASDRVILEGLVIDGHSVGTTGISFNSGASLTIEGCHVRNLYDGIDIVPTATSFYRIADTEASGSTNNGIYIRPNSANGVFSRLDVHDNAAGILAWNTTFMLADSTISGNQHGIYLNTGSDMLIGGTTISANVQIGIYNVSGVVTSFGDNNIYGNAINTSGSFGSIAKR